MFGNIDEVTAFIREKGIQQIDLRFCDLWGRWRQVTLSAQNFTAELLEEGIGFDGSSVGFMGVSSGDMVMVPDLSTGFVDPFWELPALGFICMTLGAASRELFPYDPRSIVQRADVFMQETGVADRSLWGPEFEFYIFDSVSFENSVNVASYEIDAIEGSWQNHIPGTGYGLPLHGGYHATAPRDQLHELRSRICARLDAAGVPIKYHHHEVGGPGQCEIETPLLGPVKAADATLIAKYMTRMTAVEAGMTATFMPKPLFGEAGSGLHFHQRLEKDGRNLFYDKDGYANLSDEARWYIGGILTHGGAVLAFTSPSTNSYCRLVPGYEAPVSAVFSAGNRSAAIRIPKYATTEDSVRIEFRPPDATSNPYLAIAAQLMAGIDGIRKKMDPTELGFGPVDEDIFSWSKEKRAEIKALPTSLGEALDSLETDNAFLLDGDVFSKDLIDRWVAAKRAEQREISRRPHPMEMELYYDL